MKFFPKELRNSLNEFNIEKNTEINGHLKSYLQYYQLFHPTCSYYNGYLTVNEERVFVQLFKPTLSRGTIYLLHGYFDHLGYLSPIVKQLLDLNYTVVGYDKIGHGLSTGKRAYIEDFKQYTDTLKAVLHETKKSLEGPFSVIGHSTGAAIIADYVIQNSEDHNLDKIILLAPLVRPYKWQITMISSSLLKPFISEIPRKYKKTNNNYFTNFRKDDPLQANTIPLEWVRAMHTWHRKIETVDPIQKSITIIQGKRDKVVSWEFNCKFLLNTFIGSQVHYLENGQHHIAIENESSKNEVLKIITNILKD
jgi:alpha-beta hydrolase superfamily lysophospholipase